MFQVVCLSASSADDDDVSELSAQLSELKQDVRSMRATQEFLVKEIVELRGKETKNRVSIRKHGNRLQIINWVTSHLLLPFSFQRFTVHTSALPTSWASPVQSETRYSSWTQCTVSSVTTAPSPTSSAASRAAPATVSSGWMNRSPLIGWSWSRCVMANQNAALRRSTPHWTRVSILE